MNLERYTHPAKQAVLGAQQWAQEHGHPAIEPAHLLLGLVRPSEGVVPAIVTRLAGSDDGSEHDSQVRGVHRVG